MSDSGSTTWDPALGLVERDPFLRTLWHYEANVFQIAAIVVGGLCCMASWIRCRREWDAFTVVILAESITVTIMDVMDFAMLLVNRSVCTAPSLILAVTADLTVVLHCCICLVRLAIFRRVRLSVLKHVAFVPTNIVRALVVFVLIVFTILESMSLTIACRAVAQYADTTTDDAVNAYLTERTPFFYGWLFTTVIVNVFACFLAIMCLHQVLQETRYKSLPDAFYATTGIGKAKGALQGSIAMAILAALAVRLVPYPLSMALEAFFARLYLAFQIQYLAGIHKVQSRVPLLQQSAAGPGGGGSSIIDAKPGVPVISGSGSGVDSALVNDRTVTGMPGMPMIEILRSSGSMEPPGGKGGLASTQDSNGVASGSGSVKSPANLLSSSPPSHGSAPARTAVALSGLTYVPGHMRGGEAARPHDN